MSDETAASSHAIIFHHIPKCGGSTLGDITSAQYPARLTFEIKGDKKAAIETFKSMPVDKRNRYRFIRGHQALKVVDYVESPVVLTMFRDPVDRVISGYYFAKQERSSKHPMHALTRKYDIEEFFRQGIDREWPECSNGQFASIKSALKSKAFGDPFAEETVDNLKKIIDKHFIAGLLECFDESLLLFRKNQKLAWIKPIFYKRKNVTPYTKNVPEWLVEYIQERNVKDMELYAFVKNEFRMTVDENLSGFHKELKSFQAHNRLMGSFYNHKRRFYRFVEKFFRTKY